MRVLLTGATGLVGKSLGPRLVREGFEVIALVRDPKTARARLNFPCRLYAWDGEKQPPPTEALAGVDHVIHLAGENIAEKRWSPERKVHLLESRVKSAAQFAEVLRQREIRLKSFVSASAVGFYGDRGDEVLTETSPPGTGFLSDLCQDWEQVTERIPAERVVKLRIGVVLSPLGGFLERVVPLFQRLGASRLGHGHHYLSWIHIDDLVEVLVLSLRDPRISGALNAVAPEPLTNREMTEIMARELHLISAPPVPAMALRLRYGEMANVLLGSQRAVPGALDRLGFSFRYPRFVQALNAIYPQVEAGEILLQFEQWVPAEVQKVWSFFSDENNLEEITPPLLGFQVLGKSTDQIQKGTLIDYRLKLRGIPLKWKTLISSWDPEKVFVDEQIQGPYRKWHHTHEFEPLANGVLLRDRLRFQLPLGLLGRSVALGQVWEDVHEIFAYRSKVIAQRFFPQDR